MSKFAMIVALMLVTGLDGYCLYTYPPTDPHFTYAAYASGAVAILIVYLEFFHIIYDGIAGGLERRRERKAAKQIRRVEQTPAPMEIPPSTPEPIAVERG